MQAPAPPPKKKEEDYTEHQVFTLRSILSDIAPRECTVKYYPPREDNTDNQLVKYYSTFLDNTEILHNFS